MPRQSLKHHLYVIIFGTHTPAGRAFDIALIIAILSSLAVLILESIPAVNSSWGKELRYLEYTFTALFTVEYLLRLYCSPKPAAYARSFYGVIDLLAILPPTWRSFSLLPLLWESFAFSG